MVANPGKSRGAGRLEMSCSLADVCQTSLAIISPNKPVISECSACRPSQCFWNPMRAYSCAFWKHQNNIEKRDTVADFPETTVVLLQPPKIAFTHHPYSSATLNFIFPFVILQSWLCESCPQMMLLFTDELERVKQWHASQSRASCVEHTPSHPSRLRFPPVSSVRMKVT